jgi:Xaa-Pro aminopeptidase
LWLANCSKVGEGSSIVRQANDTARAKAAVGVPARQVDEAARSLIAQHGYGSISPIEWTWVGLAVHEMPYLRNDNDELYRQDGFYN